jgi:hypothetical protein
VNSFLQGDQESYSFYDVNGIGHARNWSNKYFGSLAAGYSATAVPVGVGQNAYMTVTKTNHAHNEEVQQKFKTQAEKQKKLCGLFGDVSDEVLDPTWNPEVANQVKQSGKSIALSDPEE